MKDTRVTRFIYVLLFAISLTATADKKPKVVAPAEVVAKTPKVKTPPAVVTKNPKVKVAPAEVVTTVPEVVVGVPKLEFVQKKFESTCINVNREYNFVNNEDKLVHAIGIYNRSDTHNLVVDKFLYDDVDQYRFHPDRKFQFIEAWGSIIFENKINITPNGLQWFRLNRYRVNGQYPNVEIFKFSELQISFQYANFFEGEACFEVWVNELK